MSNRPESETHDEATRRLLVVSSALETATTQLEALIANMRDALTSANVLSKTAETVLDTTKNKPKG